MASASLTVTGTVTGLPAGSETISLTLSSASAVGAITSTVLSSGFNSIAVPTGTTFVIVTPPAGNSTSLTLKGITGDTGVALSPSNSSILSVASSQTTLGITAGGAMSSATTFIFV